jgi:hypothetical protein
MVDVDTVRYSVPYRLVQDHVDVLVDTDAVRIFQGATLVAQHVRSREPFARVQDAAHFAGLWRTPDPVGPAPRPAGETWGRDLAEYAAVITGGAQ